MLLDEVRDVVALDAEPIVHTIAIHDPLGVDLGGLPDVILGFES
jgi:hypothetical protein